MTTAGGVCRLSFQFSPNNVNRVLVTYDFRIRGFFKSISGTEEFTVVGFDADTTYGDASLTLVSQRGKGLSLAYFEPRASSTIYQNGGYHLQVRTSETDSYNCYDNNLRSSQL